MERDQLAPGEQLHTDFFSVISQQQIPRQTCRPHITSEFGHWRPTGKLADLIRKFNDVILGQYPSNPCSFCGHLLMPSQTKWVQYNPFFRYPLKEYFPGKFTVYENAYCCFTNYL